MSAKGCEQWKPRPVIPADQSLPHSQLKCFSVPCLWRAETFLISEESDSNSSTAWNNRISFVREVQTIVTHRLWKHTGTHTDELALLNKAIHGADQSVDKFAQQRDELRYHWRILKKHHKHLLLFSLSQSQTSFQYKQSPSTNISYLGFSSFKQWAAKIVISFGCHYSVQHSLTVCYGLVTKSSVLLVIHGLFISVIRKNILWGSLLLELNFWAIRSHIHKLSI